MSRLLQWLMQAIDDLVARWRNNPDCEATLALCAHLSTSPEDKLLKEVGESAETWHHDNPSVMLSVGRMYLETGMLSEAQAALVNCGRLDTKNPDPYRYLGEVLLRRGDAERCEKVLGRAMRLGANDDKTRMWRERAAVYVGLQKRQGEEAVAREVERTAPLGNAIPSSSPPTESDSARSATRRSRPPPAAARPGLKRRSAPPGPRRRPQQDAGSPSDEEEDASSTATTLADAPMPTLYGVGLPPTADSLRAAAHAEGTVPDSPSAESLLETLAEVGLFEPNSTLTPAWEAVAPAPSKRPWVVGSAALVLFVAGLSAYQYSESKRLARAAEAQTLATALSDELASADIATLKSSEQDFKALFELDSRNHQAALLWLENRVAHTLLDADPISGIEAALSRARTVGVAEPELAFGLLASSLSNGDWQQGLKYIQRFAADTSEEGMFQLLAGAIYEQAGDSKALEHYRNAVRLLPENKVAHLLAARFGLLQSNGGAVDPLVEPALSRLNKTPAALVLKALAQANSSSFEAKIELDLKQLDGTKLPATLRPVANAVFAITRLQANDNTDALLYFGRALRGSTSPALALWIGNRALAFGLQDLARRATLQASTALTSNPKLQTLAARVALAAGDIANAQKAAQGLPPTSRASSLIAAVSAYELLNLQQLDTQLSNSKATDNFDSALQQGAAVSRGGRLTDATTDSLAQANKAWGSMIAIDLALDTGNLAFATKELQKLSSSSSAVAARRARQKRAAGQSQAALAALSPILTASPQSPRELVETIFTLIDNKKFRSATKTLSSSIRAAHDLQPWLKALITASRGSRRAAKSQVKQLTLPQRNAPLLLQALSLKTLTASGDQRASQLYSRLATQHALHPDVRLAGRALGKVR